MAVAVEIGQGGGIREPALLARNQFARNIAWSMTKKGNRRSAPVVNEQVELSVFVQIAGQTTHRRHRRAVVGKIDRFESERLIARRSAGHRCDDEFVDSRIDVTRIVRQSVTVEIVQRHRCSDTRDPRGNATQRRIDVANCLWRFSGQRWQRCGAETELFGELC